MALQKSFELPSGAAGNYHAIGFLRSDPLTRDASCHLMLYTSVVARDSGKQPLVATFAKFRLYGSKWDAYLSKDALAASEKDVYGQLYQAIKDTCAAYVANPQTDGEAHLICDGGRAFYADAIDV